MKKLITLLFIAVQITAYAQVELGQSSSEVLQELTYITRGRDNWEMIKDYSGGELQAISINQYDQVFYDLNLRAYAVQIFVMKNGIYTYNILQFPTLKLDFLRSRFDSKYSNDKIGDYYFSDDFEEMRSVKEINNTASIVYQKVDFKSLPEATKKAINQKITEEATPEVVEYINPLENRLIDSFAICSSNKTVEVNTKDFGMDYEMETISERVAYCLDNKKVVLNFLPQEGIYGFYYFDFYGQSFDEVTKLILEGYDFEFDLNSLENQKMISDSEKKNYHTLQQTVKEGTRIREIRSYYNDSLGGDYIRIEEKDEGHILVHISYNGAA